MAEREYDVVLFGATGFTGHLVAERLLERAPQGTRIALAGRSLAKLGAVRDALGPDAAHWPLLLADSSNRSTMTALARSTVAVATTVGPYAKYGHRGLSQTNEFGTASASWLSVSARAAVRAPADAAATVMRSGSIPRSVEIEPGR